MTFFGEAAWCAGFVALVAILARYVHDGGRFGRSPLVEWNSIASVLALSVLLTVLAPLVWGVLIVSDGQKKLLQDVEAGKQADAPARPARARLFVNYVRVPWATDSAGKPAIGVGYAPTSTLQLPRSYNLREAEDAAEMLSLHMVDKGRMWVEQRATGPTQVHAFIVERVPNVLPQPNDITLTRDGLCRRGNLPLPREVPSTSVLYVALCKENRPTALLIFDFDVGEANAQVGKSPLRLSPYVWRHKRWERHQVQVEAGNLISIGATSEALPGMVAWEVPAPLQTPLIFFPPRSVLDDCAKWIENNPAPSSGFTFPAIGEVRLPPPKDQSTSFRCVLPFVAPFGLEVRRLMPDPPAVRTALITSSLLISMPVLVMLAVLCCWPRDCRQRNIFIEATALAVLCMPFAALLPFRVLWAYRLDMMLDYTQFGTRVAANQWLAVLAGAAIAGNAAPIALKRTPGGNTTVLFRLTASIVAWISALAIGWWAIAADAVLAAGSLVLQGALSLSVALGWWWWHGVFARLLHRRGREPVPPAMGGLTTLLNGLNPVSWLCLVFTAVLLFNRLALVGYYNVKTFSVLLNLAGAVAFGPLTFLVLSSYSTPPDHVPSKSWLTGRMVELCLLGILGFVVFYADNGVAAVLALPGAVLALFAAAHDLYEATVTLPRRSLRASQGSLAFWYAAVVSLGLVGIGLASIEGLSGNANFPRHFTFSLVAVILITFFFLCALTAYWLHKAGAHRVSSSSAAADKVALATRRYGAPLLALLAGVAVLVLFIGTWKGDALLNGILSSFDVPFARRTGMILAPSQTLLYSELDFARVLTSWRETRIQPGGGTVGFGEGFFGAQIIDPGVGKAIENDYFPIIVLRELGCYGLALLFAWFALLAVTAWAIGSHRALRTREERRLRQIPTLVFAGAVLYQPLASLGAIPFTGISWPLLGINSPSDFWIWTAVLFAALVWVDNSEIASAALSPRASEPQPWFVAATAALLCGIGTVFFVANFAASRKEPIEGKVLNEPFDQLIRVWDFADRFQCPQFVDHGGTEPDIPPPYYKVPMDEGIARYAAAYGRAWKAEHKAATDYAKALIAGKSCPERRERISRHWSVRSQRSGGSCELTFKFGWPAYRLAYPTTSGVVSRIPKCDAFIDPRHVESLGYRPPNLHRSARIRLVSEVMGTTASDLGELIGKDAVVRIRASAPAMSGTDRIGALVASSIDMGDGLTVGLHTGGPRRVEALVENDGGKQKGVPRLLMSRLPQTSRVRVLEASGERWDYRVLEAGRAVLLDRLSIIIPADSSRGVWLFRPPSEWNAGDQPSPDALLADDVSSVLGWRRRYYVYGGALPEVGWATARLGLDGWVKAGAAAYRKPPRDDTHDKAADDQNEASRYQTFVANYCGTRRPLFASNSPAASAFASVCRESPTDAVLECRTSLQPELAIRLRHLLQLIALDPGILYEHPPSDLKLPLRSSFALLRGDTGEILAQGDFVPGRESTAYAPRTSAIEKYLIEARRPPDNPKMKKQETGAVKAEWVDPVGVGSAIKPLFAAATERVAPTAFAGLRFSVKGPIRNECGGDKWPAIVGHCAPTESLWAHADAGVANPEEFLAHSYNWYQAALGLLGPVMDPLGTLSFGAQKNPMTFSELRQPIELRRPKSEALSTWTDGLLIVDGPHHTINPTSLRKSAMWQSFESLVGRELCADSSEKKCTKKSDRKDLCGARYLPIDSPSDDLRHLIALGPSTFNFAGDVVASGRGWAPHPEPLTEYFQFLRGSGRHRFGSTLQLADAYNRLLYEPQPTGTNNTYRLAASWFPAPITGRAPTPCGLTNGDSEVRKGLCTALKRGTAKSLGSWKDLPQTVVLYGAKTGTINTLGDLVERGNEIKCFQFNANLILPWRPADRQPYELSCGSGLSDSLNDSLLVVGFGVGTTTQIPMTLALQFQRVGTTGMAVQAAKPFIATVADYFGQ